MNEYKIEEIFESWMVIDGNERVPKYFNTGLINHIIQYYSASIEDIKVMGGIPVKLKYRITIEAVKDSL